jgi:anti-sigma factor RsiW
MTDRIDRYVRGELSPEEARALAQASLDSPALFDELTDAALAKAALNPRTVRAASVHRTWRKTAVLTSGLVAASVLVLILLPRRPSRREPTVKPVLDLGSNTGQPVLLASGLHPANAPVFRSGEPDSRPPKAAGVIVSVEDGIATINLGSLDGLAKGSELQVFRGSGAVGRLQVTAVFRDRARATVMEGKQLRPKNEVRVGGADHLNALLQQVDAAFNRGEPGAAIKLAEEAVRWGQSAAVPPGAMAVSWNQLAVLQTLRGEYDSAESHLLQAVSATSKTDPVYYQIQNNLGVLGELRGERDKAARSYHDALGAGPGEQRQIVERNLSRVRGSR